MSAARRRKGSGAARLRRFWIAILVLGLLGGAGAYALLSWSGFRVHAIVVRGAQHVSRAAILARAQVSPGESMWLLQTHAIAARIEAIPDVLTARVWRSIPNTLRIDITERTPFARVAVAGARGVVDEHLRVLTPTADPPPMLPLFVVRASLALVPGRSLHDPGLIALRDDEQLLTAAGVTPTRLTFDRYRELAITLPSGVRVLLGDQTQLPQKIALIRPILRTLTHNGRPIRTLDLRAPSAPVVVYRA